MHMGYDANGNQVELIDGRGHVSRLIYDGLNRLIGTVNPSGGLTTTVYDAMGNIVARQAGGFAAPTLVGGAVQHSFTSSEGVTLFWETSHATDGVVYVRRAGSSDAFQSFGISGNYTPFHEVTLHGLAPATSYEYHIVSKDAFGYTLTTATQFFQTIAGAVVGPRRRSKVRPAFPAARCRPSRSVLEDRLSQIFIFATLWRSMKALSTLLLIVSVLLTSSAWAADAYYHGVETSDDSAAVLGGHHDTSSDQDVQSHHCGHLAHHFFGQPPAGLQLTQCVPSVRFESLAAPPPLSVSDTPMRPPRPRLS